MKALKIFTVLFILSASALFSFVLFKKFLTTETSVSTTEDEIEDASLTQEEFNVELYFEITERAYLNQSGKIDVKVDPSVYELPGVDIVISYEPEYITVDLLEESSALSNYLVKEIDSENGLITISAIADVESLIKTKSTLLTINYTAIKEGSTTLAFVEGEEQNPDTVISLVSEDATRAPLTLQSLSIVVTTEPEETEIEEEFPESVGR